ncbi:pollen preferential protein [Cinnamomum micranthum f. kanehirae]|uniref:Pollen preferential protein n=1 Tax=Cinnamomum micranthum f. kanehirae TaxID=337451 RepID=A0A443P3S6_9MAGN|nr:pollen preferential protein [Cinnamomum micranthum f. kanehirae]
MQCQVGSSSANPPRRYIGRSSQQRDPVSAVTLRRPPMRKRCAEMAGGTTAECAAVCCCCPFGLLNLAVLAFVRLPAALCRKAIKKQGRKRKVSILQHQTKGSEEDAEREDCIGSAEISPGKWPDIPPSEAVSEMEVMWTKLNGTGFWRSPSEREH